MGLISVHISCSIVYLLLNKRKIFMSLWSMYLWLMWSSFFIFCPSHFSDFDMSDVQQEHALEVERLAPRLAALRIELCPGYMSEGCFWKIYFVLLHPRLSKHDAVLLSTSQACLSSVLKSLILIQLIIHVLWMHCPWCTSPRCHIWCMVSFLNSSVNRSNP